MASKTAQPKILKIASNQCKSWLELWILGRGRKKPNVLSSEECNSSNNAQSSFIPKQVQLKVFLILCELITFFYLKLFNSVYHFWGPSIRSPLCSQKLSPNSSRPRFGIKWIVFCAKSIKKVLYLTKKGSWRTSYGLPFFSPWDTPLPFTRLEVSKEYLKEYFQKSLQERQNLVASHHPRPEFILVVLALA